jgi:hypothetical protein
MAAYTYLGGEDTIQTLASNISREAMRFTYRANDSGVVFGLVFGPWPSPNWTDEVLAEQAAYWAGNWNENARVPGVTGIDVTQDTDGLGNLVDVARVAIVSTSGLTTSIVNVGVRSFLPSVAGTTLTTSFGDAVRAAIAQLDAVEG